DVSRVCGVLGLGWYFQARYGPTPPLSASSHDMRRVSEHKRPQGKQVGLNIRLRGEDQVKVAGRLRGFRHILLFTMIWLSLSSFLISIAYGSPVKELGTARPTPSVTVTDGENVVDSSFSAAWERQSLYALGRYWVF